MVSGEGYRGRACQGALSTDGLEVLAFGNRVARVSKRKTAASARGLGPRLDVTLKILDYYSVPGFEI